MGISLHSKANSGSHSAKPVYMCKRIKASTWWISWRYQNSLFSKCSLFKYADNHPILSVNVDCSLNVSAFPTWNSNSSFWRSIQPGWIISLPGSSQYEKWFGCSSGWRHSCKLWGDQTSEVWARRWHLTPINTAFQQVTDMPLNLRRLWHVILDQSSSSAAPGFCYNFLFIFPVAKFHSTT